MVNCSESWVSDIGVDDFVIDAGTGITTGTNAVNSYELAFSGSHLFYQIPDNNRTQHVSIKLYTTQGKQVATLVNKDGDAGEHTVRIDRNNSAGHTLAAGLYMCRMKTGSFSKTVTIIIR